MYDVKNPTANGLQVTPSDGTDLPSLTTWLWVGTGGNVTVQRPDGSSHLYKNVPSGSALPIRVSRVMATGTTASDIVANW